MQAIGVAGKTVAVIRFSTVLPEREAAMPKAGYSLKWGLVTGCICSQSLSGALRPPAAQPRRKNFANLSLERT